MTRTADPDASRHYEVLVLGAGLSGLACASRLYAKDYFKQAHKLFVLEGRDRIGGRINSVYVNGNRLDTGANWIHGIGTKERPNPLMTVLPHQRYKVLSGTVAFKVPDSLANNGVIPNGDVSHSNGSIRDDKAGQVIPADIAGILNDGVWGTIESLHELAKSLSAEEAKKTTIFDGIIQSKSFQETYQALPKKYHATFGSMLQFVENIEAGPLTEHTVERPEGKPGMSVLEYAIDDFDGDQVFLQDGYIAIINELAKDLMNDNLVGLNIRIQQIDWSSKPIVIHTSQGKFTADDVVCTLPLGVLKDRSSNFFVPELPQDKSDAVAKLGFGTLNKIFLVYDEPWWNDEPYTTIMKHGLIDRGISSEAESNAPDILVGSTEELPGIEIQMDGTIGPGTRNIDMINLHNLVGIPVLSCFTSCATAARLEHMSDTDVGELVHRTLSKWFGAEPPKPTAVHLTRWASDPFSKGSYTHMIAGVSERTHRAAFQSPVTNEKGATLRFAGEHTSVNHFAVAHGALITGWNEADKILQSTHVTL